MIRSIALVSAGTLASRLTGFARDALVAALLGAGVIADAFLIAFQLVTVVRRLLTEGAFNAAFVPAWLRLRARDDDAASAFAGRALGSVTLIVVAAALLIGLAMPWATSIAAPALIGTHAVELTRWMLPYLAFAGPVAVLMALNNAQHRVALSTFAPLLFNAALIAVILALLWMPMDASRAALIVAAAVGVAGVLQLAMLLIASGENRPHPRIGFDPQIRRVLGRAVPGMIANAGPQMLMAAGAIIASRAPSAVSWLYFASRLVDLPLGIIGNAAGAVLLPQLTHAVHADNAPAEAEARGVVLALALALPAAVGLFVLAEPIVRVVFERGAFTEADSRATAAALQALACGLPAQALFKALAARFYAKDNPATPMMATLAGLVVAIAGSLLLMPTLGVFGVAMAIALGAWTSAIWLLARGQTFVSAAINPALRILAASAAMGVSVQLVALYWPPAATHLAAALRLGGLMACGVIVYAIGLLLTGAVRGLRGPVSRGKGTPGDGRESQSK